MAKKRAILNAVAAAAAVASVATPTWAISPTPGPDAMRAELLRAWDDATVTWQRILGPRAYASELPQINFVTEVRPLHCYGLYVSAGPVYCSGNNTVFVSLTEMERHSGRFGGAEPSALAFLVAHELGHHVQKVSGRFRVHALLARQRPDRLRELSLRFELEADCLAGVWASNSGGFAADANVRRKMMALIDSIGDDKMQTAANGAFDPETFTHGDSEQRKRWYSTGLNAGTIAACNVMESADF